MARTSTDYKNLLKHLLPLGHAWTRDDDSRLVQLLYGMAEEFARVEERTENLITEALVTTTTECISEHEYDFGIGGDGEIEDRRSVLHGKLVAVGQQYKEYFEEIASALGWTIYIEEFTPLWTGIGSTGMSCGNNTNLFYYKVRIYADGDIGGFSCGFRPDGFEAHYLNDRILMEQVVPLSYITYLTSELQRIRPAHSHPLFDFYGRGFSRGFGWGYYAMPWYDGVCYPGGFGRGFGDGFANQRDYSGDYLIGGFTGGFNLGFNAYQGGGFAFKAFTTGFSRMH